MDDDPTGATAVLDYGATVQFAPGHNVAYGAHTGTKWSLAWNCSDAAADPWKTDRLRFCLNAGYPFMMFKYSVPTSSTTPYIQITAKTWVGVAPTSLHVAGAAPHRTVPMSMPPWTSFCRSRGATGVDERAATVGSTTGAANRIAATPAQSRVTGAMGTKQGQQAVRRAADAGSTAAKLAVDLLSAAIPGGGLVKTVIATGAKFAVGRVADEAIRRRAARSGLEIEDN